MSSCYHLVRGLSTRSVLQRRVLRRLSLRVIPTVAIGFFATTSVVLFGTAWGDTNDATATATATATAVATGAATATDAKNARIEALSVRMFAAQGEEKRAAIRELMAYNDPSLIPTFVLAMRWTGSHRSVAEALSTLTGETMTDWHDAYEWQERHPDVTSHHTFTRVKLRFLGNTDKRFNDVLSPYVQNSLTQIHPPERLGQPRIRLEEIVWGGVLFDGIASLDAPAMVSADAADYLNTSDLVFGVSLNGDARAYPLRIMGWHEMMNDVVGGVPVALSYCTLCGSGILYETAVEGLEAPLIFGSSGLLYRSNKLMFDRSTRSLWNQFSGEPVVGPMVSVNDTGLRLTVKPMSITSWGRWKSQNPHTTVLSLETGYERNYDSGVTYQAYFDSPDLMFPATVSDESEVHRKDFVFGIRTLGASRAWPIEAFIDQPVINDRVGGKSVVLTGNARTRTAMAFERMEHETFVAEGDHTLSSNGELWSVTDAFLVSADGKKRRPRVAGQVSYWFAWDNFMGVKSSLYQP